MNDIRDLYLALPKDIRLTFIDRDLHFHVFQQKYDLVMRDLKESNHLMILHVKRWNAEEKVAIEHGCSWQRTIHGKTRSTWIAFNDIPRWYTIIFPLA